ncbi:MAG: hypothetical protein ABI728_04225 [Betaproteobacteria bacterium]
MSDKTLRNLIAAVIALLLIFQIGTLISGAMGMVWGAVSAAVIIAVSFFSARLARAGGKSSFWFLVPTLLLIVIPIVMMIWKVWSDSSTWFDRVVALAPFLVGFGAPIVLLLIVYFELRKRTVGPGVGATGTRW